MEKSLQDIESAYSATVEYAKNHYENFPVISILIPRHLRKHVSIIYWFARTADDLADEGEVSEEIRLKNLNDFEIRLTQLLDGNPNNNLELALKNTIEKKQLNTVHFYNLLKAFKQDVTKKKYESYDELLNYCENSANPVGRLILELFNIRDENAFLLSDKICTALQLTNFYQDVSVDWEKGRIYIPQDELEKYEVRKKVFEINENSLNFKSVLKANIERTEKLFVEGRQLLKYLRGRLKFEIAWTILGGEKILDKIKKIDYDVLNQRPELTKSELIILFFKSLFINE